MKQTTVGDLIAALSQYPVGTPVVGTTMEGSISNVFSIQEAHEVTGLPTVKDTLVNVSLHAWPARMLEPGGIMGLVEPVEHQLPRIVPMDALPANSNPFRHDLYHMGCEVSGPWMAMYAEHCGHKQDHNKTAEEKASPGPIWNDDPKYIILINQRTGQRFKMIWDVVTKPDVSDVMQALLLQRECDERLSDPNIVGQRAKDRQDLNGKLGA